MWIIPSKRDHLIERVFSVAPPTLPGIVAVTEADATRYKDKVFPKGWSLHVVECGPFLRDKLNKVYKDFPEEKFYGVVGDDSVPETPGWDTFLAEKAGNRNIAGSNEVYIKNGHMGASALGGDLIRACGWLFLPHVTHFYADDAFELIGKEFNCFKKYNEIRIAHLHHSTGHAPFDDVYRERSGGNDEKAFRNWQRNEWPTLREKLAPLYS